MNNVISNKFSFLTLSGELIRDVISIELNDNGEFSKITYFKDGLEHTLDSDSYTYTNLILEIPGIGYAYCGDILTIERYREKARRYELGFGWHKNVSNQKIYSWFITQPVLSDGETREYKTLYYEDLCNILAIEHISAGIVPAEQET